MSDQLNVTRGVEKKAAAAGLLIDEFKEAEGITGEVFTGFPFIPAPGGSYAIDATLVSPTEGLVLFELVEGTDTQGYKERQDDLANKMEAHLRIHPELVRGRELLVPINVITYAPGAQSQSEDANPLLASHGQLRRALDSIVPENDPSPIYEKTLSVVQNVATIRQSRSKREIHNEDSRGAKLRRLEESIATLDSTQNKAVVQTVEGVQRIRGLAGSGKTIILALKAAYLHTQYPDWRIAVTFNTRSLKGQFQKFINIFRFGIGSGEPDWTKLRVVNAWGAPGDDNRDGIYHEYCRATGSEFLDFNEAKQKFGGAAQAFGGACNAALDNADSAPELYDVILVDEAQDLPPSFLKLCYAMLRAPKRLVYAYDELQNLSGASVLSPTEIFGTDAAGRPQVSLDNDPARDVILPVCYRNSRPVLVTAHSLGFGIYREPPPEASTGLVQMFDYPALWKEIGYETQSGHLEEGQHVTLARPPRTSPTFLEDHSRISDLVQFLPFPDKEAQNDWLIEEIRQNLTTDELRHDDIVVVNPDPFTTRRVTGPIRSKLFEASIPSHLAGVDTDPDVFFKTGTASVTFTGIYRAKGNEAGMVYVINAQDCDGSGPGLAMLRNRLFTAITRSKAWVRVTGYGPKMDSLIREFEALKQRSFTLDFDYPTDAMLSRLRIVHRDVTPEEKRELEGKKTRADELLRDLERGELHAEDLDEATRQALLEHLGPASR